MSNFLTLKNFNLLLSISQWRVKKNLLHFAMCGIKNKTRNKIKIRSKTKPCSCKKFDILTKIKRKNNYCLQIQN
jgi:hypothetical protein